MRSNYKRLGDYIQPVEGRNKILKDIPLMGLSINKVFIPSIANIIGTDMSTYRLIRRYQFAYGPVTSRNGEKITIALFDQHDEALISQAYFPFEVIDAKKLLPEYLMMWFKRPEFDRYARFMSHGSAREIFSWEDMCNTRLPIPHPDKQREIVAEYHTIQKRIELNKQLIKKLEETAQGVYKQWFIEFEFPDADGKPYKSNGGAMVWCEELGKEIPKGWKVGELQDLIDIKYGKAYSHLEVGNIPLYGSGGLMGTVNKALYGEPSVLIPRKGTLSNIMFVNHPFWCLDTMFFSVFKDNVNGYYSFHILKQLDFEALNQGSAVPSMTTAFLNYIEVIIPNRFTLMRFTSVLEKLHAHKTNVLIEVQQLVELGHLLLSKLATVDDQTFVEQMATCEY